MPTLAHLPPPDLTPWHMVMNATFVVQLVMGILAVASVATWTILISKSIELSSAQRQLRSALGFASVAPTLEAFRASVQPAPARIAALLDAAADELRLSDSLPPDGIKERIAQQLQRTDAALLRRMSRGTGVLATVGACAPFVGLFGTVWGIMNSFVGISQMQTTNLAAVAPGIAEALLATAGGLVAAIPAVIIYNGFARAMAGHRALLGDLSSRIWNLASRDLDRQRAVPSKQEDARPGPARLRTVAE